jgi:hypothetical protein
VIGEALSELARMVTDPSAFGETEVVTYVTAAGTLSLNAVVERRPPAQDIAGGTQTTTVNGQIWLRREDLTQPQVGQDTVTLRWTDGTLRTARIEAELANSRGLWHLGFVL